MPKISVLMGAYNCAHAIEASIQSILKQTFTDWEFLICDDASTDGTFDIIKRLYSEDKRFTLFKNSSNSGLPTCLNRCISSSSGDFLARQDADDISYPDRFKEQLAFLESNTDVSAVGTYADLFNQGFVWGRMKAAIEPKLLDWVKGFGVIDASVMMKRSDCLVLGMFDQCAPRQEGYDLWVRMVASGLKIRTLPKVLYSIRWDNSTYSRRKLKSRIAEARIRLLCLRRLKAPIIFYLYIFKPLLIAVLPSFLVSFFHFCKFKNKNK